MYTEEYSIDEARKRLEKTMAVSVILNPKAETSQFLKKTTL